MKFLLVLSAIFQPFLFSAEPQPARFCYWKAVSKVQTDREKNYLVFVQRYVEKYAGHDYEFIENTTLFIDKKNASDLLPLVTKSIQDKDLWLCTDKSQPELYLLEHQEQKYRLVTSLAIQKVPSEPPKLRGIAD